MVRRDGLWILGLALLLPAIFFGTQHLISTPPALPPPWFLTVVDRSLPTVPWTVWLYLSWYVVVPCMAVAPGDVRRRFTCTVLLSFFACEIGYLVWPITISRADPLPGGGVSETALATLYTLDPPRNLFPSFHAALAVAVAAAVRGSPRWRLPSGLWAFAVCVACVLTKQHYTLDVVAGAVVGMGSHALARVLVAVPERRPSLVEPRDVSIEFRVI
jgi:membrane-associated phospholipid phosphatase